jgi:hypothetical protein
MRKKIAKITAYGVLCTANGGIYSTMIWFEKKKQKQTISFRRNNTRIQNVRGCTQMFSSAWEANENQATGTRKRHQHNTK